MNYLGITATPNTGQPLAPAWQCIHETCADGSKCYLSNLRCDGIPACDDGSDEWNCGKPGEHVWLTTETHVLPIFGGGGTGAVVFTAVYPVGTWTKYAIDRQLVSKSFWEECLEGRVEFRMRFRMILSTAPIVLSEIAFHLADVTLTSITTWEDAYRLTRSGGSIDESGC